MTAHEVIQRYEEILVASDQMVLAAEENRWEDLINIEVSRRNLISEVTQATATPDADMKQQREVLIHRILSADEKVKVLTENWMTEIQGILQSLSAERKLAKAYEMS